MAGTILPELWIIYLPFLPFATGLGSRTPTRTRGEHPAEVRTPPEKKPKPSGHSQLPPLQVAKSAPKMVLPNPSLSGKSEFYNDKFLSAINPLRHAIQLLGRSSCRRLLAKVEERFPIRLLGKTRSTGRSIDRIRNMNGIFGKRQAFIVCFHCSQSGKRLNYPYLYWVSSRIHQKVIPSGPVSTTSHTLRPKNLNGRQDAGPV